MEWSPANRAFVQNTENNVVHRCKYLRKQRLQWVHVTFCKILAIGRACILLGAIIDKWSSLPLRKRRHWEKITSSVTDPHWVFAGASRRRRPSATAARCARCARDLLHIWMHVWSMPFTSLICVIYLEWSYAPEHWTTIKIKSYIWRRLMILEYSYKNQ